jgi:hypothetical protein
MYVSRAFHHARRFTASLIFFLALALVPVTSAFATVTTTGEQKTAVILVNFQDDTSQPISRADAQAMVFGTVSDFYWEASYQKTFLSGDTYGWYTIPVSRTVCNTIQFAQEADKLATAAGVDLSKYTRLVYLMPQNSCSGAGFNSGTALPTRMWMLSNNLSAQLIAHELGHNFGLSHSQALECGTSAYGGSCSVKSYGDTADTMGSGPSSHFNATQKETLGWLNASGQPPITTVTSSGSYSLAPFETTGTAAKALKIARGIDPDSGAMSYYYVEYRQPIGFDAGLSNVGNLTRGVLVHTGGVDQFSMLLDMTPDSIPTSTFSDSEDGALDVGRTYVDSVAGISITLKSASASGAVVEVGLNGSTPPVATCTRAAPTLSLSGPTASVAAGSTITYTVSLGNRDSSACAATSFNLARSVPSGWTGTLGASSLSLSPGASASTTLSVTSPASAAAGSYGIGVGASSNAGSIHTVNAAATYSVTATATGMLTETVGTNKTAYVRGETVSMSARVFGNGVPVAGASVRFNVTMPGGGVTAFNAVSGSDGYARSTLKLGKGKAALGTYQLRADASSGGQTATAGTSFSVR